MRITDTTSRFGSISIYNHWLTAGLIVGLIGLGWYFEELPRGPEKASLLGLHMGLGLVVLGLGLFRLGWRWLNRMPAAAGDHAPWEQRLARIAHMMLLALLVIMPLSGMLSVMAEGHTVSFFGLFALPPLVGPSETLEEITGAMHGLGANLLVATIGLHVAGALKHHIFDRDDTLTRMLPNQRTTDAAVRAGSGI